MNAFQTTRRGRGLVATVLLALLALAWAPPASAAPTSAAPAKRLAVLELTGTTDRAILSVFSDQIRQGALLAVKPLGYEVMTRENQAVLASAMGIDLEACQDGAECEVELGRNIGADLVVSGGVTTVGSVLVVTLKLHTTATASLLASKTIKAGSQEALLDELVFGSQQLMAEGLDLGPVQRTARRSKVAGGNVQSGMTLDRGEKIKNEPTDETGFLVVEASPEGANIFVNGEEVGRGKVQLERMVGRYVVVAELGKLYHPARQEIQLDSNKTKVSLELKPAFGTLDVTSIPSRATVWLNGDKVGVTPFVARELPSGDYTLRLDLKDHLSDTADLTVSDGELSRFIGELKPNFGILVAHSTPVGARIELNGEPTGEVTPHNFERVPAGVVELRLSLDGYGEQVLRPTLTRDEVLTVDAVLEAKIGYLSVMVTSPGGALCEASVSVDGRKQPGSAPMKLKLPARSVELTAECGGLVAAKTVRVVHNEKIKVKLEVAPRVRGFSAGTPPVAGAGAAAASSGAPPLSPAGGAFAALEEEYESFLSIRIPPETEEAKAALRSKTESLAKLEAKYVEVLDSKSPEWSIAALFRIGTLYGNFADTLVAAPCPPELDEAQCSLYKVMLQDRAYPLRDKAAQALESALKKSYELGLYTPHTYSAAELLRGLRPEQFPALVEHFPPRRRSLKSGKDFGRLGARRLQSGAQSPDIARLSQLIEEQGPWEAVVDGCFVALAAGDGVRAEGCFEAAVKGSADEPSEGPPSSKSAEKMAQWASDKATSWAASGGPKAARGETAHWGEDARVGLAIVRRMRGKLDEAMKVYRELTVSRVCPETALLNQGIVEHLFRKDYRRAGRTYKKLARCSGDNEAVGPWIARLERDSKQPPSEAAGSPTEASGVSGKASGKGSGKGSALRSALARARALMTEHSEAVADPSWSDELADLVDQSKFALDSGDELFVKDAAEALDELMERYYEDALKRDKKEWAAGGQG